MQTLDDLLEQHKKHFRNKLIEALSKKNCISFEKVVSEYSDFIDNYILEKYKDAEELINRINNSENIVLLNIRRDRENQDRCKICEANQPNIDLIAEKFKDVIELIEIGEAKPGGAALYHIIFHEEVEEKKVPLTAVIKNGNILRFWAGKTVEPSVYERYIKKALCLTL